MAHEIEIDARDVGDAIVAAMAEGGIDHLFFSSGTELGFYQEAIAKARALGRPAPRLITMTHEYVGLNAALGYAAVSGKPAVTSGACRRRHAASRRRAAHRLAQRPAGADDGGRAADRRSRHHARRARRGALLDRSRPSTRTASSGSSPSGTIGSSTRTIPA